MILDRLDVLQLRDAAIEILPRAQQARDQAKKTHSTSEHYSTALLSAASSTLGDATITAVERAAANVLREIETWSGCDPNSAEQQALLLLDAKGIKALMMGAIARAANLLEQATCRKFEITIPADSAAPAAKVEAKRASALITQNKLRQNTLDPAINKAIEKANSYELAPVYLKLKELAISGELPFTSMIEGDALYYTNDNNEQAKLSKAALGKRLKRVADNRR